MPATVHYDVGDAWVPQATFKVAGVNTDPTTITVKVKEPDGTITTMGPVSGATGGGGITRASAGVYTITVDLDDTGYWYALFTGTGTAAGSEQHEAIVDPSEFHEAAQLGTRSLVSLGETKDWLQRQNIDTGEDLDLARVIVDISDRVQQEAEREFKPYATNPATRTFAIEQPRPATDLVVIDGELIRDRNPRSRLVAIGDLTSFTQVQIIDTDWTTVLETIALADITSHPLVRKPWEPITHLEFHSDVTSLTVGMRVAVLGTWGFPAVPGDIRQAVLDGIAAVMDRNVEHYSMDLGAPTANEGGTVVMVGGSQRILSLPPSALAAAWRYRNPGVG